MKEWRMNTWRIMNSPYNRMSVRKPLHSKSSIIQAESTMRCYSTLESLWKRCNRSCSRWRIKERRNCRRVSIWTRCDTSGTSSTLSRLTFSKENALICGFRVRPWRLVAISGMRISCPVGSLADATTGAPVVEVDLGLDSRPAESPLLARALIKRAFRFLQLAALIMLNQNLSVVSSLKAGRCLERPQQGPHLWNNPSTTGCQTIEFSNWNSQWDLTAKGSEPWRLNH